MSISMNSVNRTSAAEQAAKAAKADFTAPVAVNRGQPERADNNGAQARQQAQRSAAAASSAPAKAPAGPAPARSAPSNGAAPAAKSGKASQTNQADQADERDDEAAVDASAAAPFARLIDFADIAVTRDDGAASATPDHANQAAVAQPAAGDTNGADTLPAMITSMLNLGAATPAAADPARGDAVSAVSTLNTSATRLNLAAVNVAVNVTATAQAAAQQQTAGAATQGVYHLAAAQVAVARPGNTNNTDAPAADTELAAAAPAAAAADAAPQPAVAAVPRAPQRAAEAPAAAPAADAGAALATSGAAKDENRASTAAPAANNGGVGLATGAPAAPAAAGTTVKLAGTPEQWQQPLRQALGERLQVNLQRNNDHAVIRLEPPNMGSIEISIRHTAGSLQISLTANNSEVVRQLNTIGDSVRQDLSTRQFTDVAVTVSSTRAQGQAQSQPDGGGRNGQQRGQDDGRTPGRALSEDGAASLFAMTSEQE